jgi:CPA2 family monovalent cation:H+ antiporter-2
VSLWGILLDLLILLTAAMLLGGLFERVKLSPLLGYLLAGTLLGPNALNLLPGEEPVASIAELGVALLLFTIGLEFSWKRLRATGPVALAGGTLQVLVTGVLTSLVCIAAGLPAGAAVVFGAVVALSSTAAVIRLLESRAEIDAVHGRYAVGILLLQDIAVVPLVLLVAFLGGGTTTSEIGWSVARTLVFAALLIATLYLLLNFGLPKVLGGRVAGRFEDLPILLAVVVALGATWLSHELGVSPALGAFVAGMLLAESPFATRIRADIIPFRTLFVTLFFCSIGMLVAPAWIADNWPLLVVVTLAVVIGKTAVTTGVVRAFGVPIGPSLATGMVLAQVGEFSLVVAASALQVGLIGAGEFDLVVATMMATLFVTPALIGAAPRLSWRLGRGSPVGMPDLARGVDPELSERLQDHVVLVGFGPAGQRVAELTMADRDREIVVVELDRRTAEIARNYGLGTLIGDAARAEVLTRVGVESAACVVITVPDPWTARHIVQQVGALAPLVPIVVRSRYHVHRWQLTTAGADAVVDEEQEVGIQIAREVRLRLLEASEGP